MKRFVPIGAAATILASSAMAEPGAVLHVDADLPGPIEFEAPEALRALAEGVVLLDLRIAPELEPAIILKDGGYGSLDGCEFGPVEADTVMVATGSNHMLLEVRMGDPVQHAGNLLSCNYDPNLISDDGFGHMTRLKGCFFAHATSIPTAVHWRLNPLPAEACGFGD
jgi:hypothetical protein